MYSAAPSPEEPKDRAFSFALAVIVLAVLAIAIFGCSPKVIEKVVYRTDTTYIEKVQIDSVYKRDSVLVREKGDTIYIYKERIREKYKFLRDTVRLVKVDSIAVERIKEVEVPVPPTKCQSFKMRAFWPLSIIVLLLLLWILRKPILKLIGL